jgi:hypothetical protein
MGAYTWIVVIVREGVSEVTGFFEYEAARVHFETMSMNWSESYLCEVVIGPKV